MAMASETSWSVAPASFANSVSATMQYLHGIWAATARLMRLLYLSGRAVPGVISTSRISRQAPASAAGGDFLAKSGTDPKDCSMSLSADLASTTSMGAGGGLLEAMAFLMFSARHERRSSVCIDTPASAVWSVLSRLDGIHLWVDSIKHSHCPAQRRGVGASRVCEPGRARKLMSFARSFQGSWPRAST